MDKKPLIVGIIMLFLSTACLPALASEGKHGLVSPTTDQVDNNDEIITFISGSTFEGIAIHRWGIIRDVSIYAIFGGTGLDIEGWKRNPTERFFYSGVNSIHAPRFLGFSVPTSPGVFVIGIAFGNIEWS